VLIQGNETIGVRVRSAVRQEYRSLTWSMLERASAGLYFGGRLMTATCDCCKRSVQTVNETGACFACDTFHMFTMIIKENTNLRDDEAVQLAGDLQEHILSEIIERLRLPDQEHPLAMELLQTMERREAPL
jgi:hypothetical protein